MPMARTTIMADAAVLERLRVIATQEGKSLAAVIREGLELRARRPRPTWIGSFSSGYTDTSQRVDEIINDWLGRSHDL